ncbi:MAG: aminofutalosine synthase MqnE [Planctomycetota bacterium]|nr:MAG: aminofutalosine synthase MqnE [Planctomycetota bacterium]REK12594.1 MAG: aminofutalosine synthase MqnE [Planctomycetota bacterium]REK23681.1 MAG: aminofutalosine synthase MqnE [Planctomycetota bacterium]REK43528.1 MAG: aminofutalosine synthase MqnE [Planctomycetota bacterium]
MISTAAPQLQRISDKVHAGERLTFDEGLYLYSPEVPLGELAVLANLVRERKNGNLAYYNINTHLNPTNVCVYRCSFCAFRADLRDEKGYLMSDEQILDRGREASENGCTEMHIVGGLHHQMKYDWYLNVVRILHEAYPRLHLKGWTAVEINWFAHLTKRSYREILTDLVEAGLGSMPGGGAEIFHPEVRDQICEHKADATNWFEIHRTAHELGLRTNCTMLYGHIEKPYHRIDHLVRLRELQDETGGLQTFIPLAFLPENTGLDHIRRPSAVEDLRTMAISRLMLDNIDHIKAYWIMLGIGVAQTALAYGADDLDGTVRHELIYHDAGADTPEILSVEDIRRLIEEAGRTPIERDTIYREVIRDGADWRVGEPIEVGA